MTSILNVTDLHAGYGQSLILHGVSLHVEPQEIVLIAGPNGAGKSTVLKAIAGLASTTGGQVSLRERDITRLNTERLVSLGIGYVPQVSNVFPSLTVRENLEISRPTSTALQRVLDRFPSIRQRLHLRGHALSGGERQLLALGRALLNDPSVLLLDEPSAALSPIAAQGIFETVREIREAGTAILLVEQNVQLGLEVSDRAYILDSGHNAIDGPSSSVAADPRIAALYLGGAIEDLTTPQED
ncbi:ABC transporter ATP-binding protein [Deinococcus sp. SM5_A1]|uniref:ABC transporter ATP-binding protein n=1 Tax=Deinococcus sp. SM5_A1 TaxID=3379094 RepID=UPI0038598350